MRQPAWLSLLFSQRRADFYDEAATHTCSAPPDNLPEALTARVGLIWDKTIIGTGDLSAPWGLSHETITFAVYEPSAANRKKNYGGLSARMRQGSVLREPRPNGAATSIHPTAKPPRLIRRLIESSTSLGDPGSPEVVLDPFMGAGSTLVGAALAGRDAIGIEVEKKYADRAITQLEQVRNNP